MLLLPLVLDSGVIDQKVLQISARKKIKIFLEVFFLLNEQAGFVWDVSQIVCFAVETYILPSYA